MAASPESGGTAGVLVAERARATFDVSGLLKIVAGSRPATVDKYRGLFAGPPFDDEDMDDYKGYAELFERKIERVAAAFKIVRTNPDFMIRHKAGRISMGDMFESSGIYLHFTMALTFIRAQSSPEQAKVWLPLATEGKYIAAYCQTELGHGSNVRGLETTATYDPAAGEFEVHSPTLTSLKWWPTGMYACTHALTFAQLIVGGKNYGFHGFMVQLRDADGKPMPGVEIGEIGPKLNATATNIGYCRFTRVRIPRFNMFAKYSQVTADGKYVAAPKKVSKFRYISMMAARTSIVSVAYANLAQAVTIAVRYSAVRLQGFKDTTKDGGTEHAVLDYQMQRYRLFKALALAYTLLWNMRYIADYMKRVQTAMQKGDDSAADDLPELHATLSGLKATSTVWAHEHIEECRKCCGGQGFLRSSGIARLSPAQAEWATVEGEQVILSLQLARFLIKSAADADAGKPVVGTAAYLAEKGGADAAAAAGIAAADAGAASQAALALLKDRARRFARRLATKFGAAMKAGARFDEALNANAVLAYKAAECHSSYAMVRNYDLALRQFVKDPATSAALRRLLCLHSLSEITEHAGDWLGVLSEQQVHAAEDRVTALLGEIRPDAVALVDAFGWTDSQLSSTIGRADGNVYEAIYAQARKSPLNRSPAMVGWPAYSAVLDLDFLRQGAKTQHARL